MERGELVSDDLVCEMVRRRLKQPDCKRGYILDGFPRTAAQAGWLDALLEIGSLTIATNPGLANCDPAGRGL